MIESYIAVPIDDGIDCAPTTGKITSYLGWVVLMIKQEQFPCPCCGYLTLRELGDFENCPVCWWEDDGQGDEDADVVRGGPNGSLSLTQARRNFRSHGASDRRYVEHVRPPRPSEVSPN
jgi:hypothetical protein